MHRGYVKNYRKGLDHPLFIKPLVWHFWNYCLLKANHKTKIADFNGKPIEVKRGSFIMSNRVAAKETGLTFQNVRTCIKTLLSHNMLKKSTQELTQQATLLNVCNYGVYQHLETISNTDANTQVTHEQHTDNTRLTTNNNDNNIKNDNKKDITDPIVKKDRTEKHYSKDFEKLCIDYPNTKGSKSQTYKNYNTCIKKFKLDNNQIYTACMNSVQKQIDDGNGDFIYQLSNVLGQKYSGDLPELLKYEAPKKPKYDFL